MIERGATFVPLSLRRGENIGNEPIRWHTVGDAVEIQQQSVSQHGKGERVDIVE